MIKLTVLFDEPFWIGIFEKQDQDKIQICRVVFGQEPKDYEVYDFILERKIKLKENRENKKELKFQKRQEKKSQKKKGH